MKVRNIVFCLVTVFFTGQALEMKGQTATDLIVGSLDTTLAIEQVKITYSNTYYSSIYFWNQSNTMETAPINGKFAFRLPENSGERYFKLSFVGKGKRNKSLAILNECTFFALGDMDIAVRVDENACVFTGKQQSFFEAQYRMKALQKQYDSEYLSITDGMRKRMKIDSANQNDIYYQYLVEYKDLDQRVLSAMERLAENYDDLSTMEKDILKLNVRSDLELKFDINLLFQSSIGPDSSNDQVRNAILKFRLNQNFLGKHDVEGNEHWEKSWSYIEHLYYRSLADLTVPLQASDRKKRTTFEDLYNYISKEYDGLLLDRLLATTFFNYGMSKELPIGYYEKALSLIKDPESASIIQDLAASRQIGNAGFNFTLEDTAGNNVSFDDLKGKVVVMDFWFTGCHGCASLTTAMKDVHEYFEKDRDVVFVNISIDRDRQKWIESVRLGKYTHSGGVNLYTGGTGEKHTIIQHYKIAAYPTLIIFDRQGKIAQFNPKGPFTEQHKSKLINRIKEL